MKTKPILFSTEMVQAILEGRKTQTRRVVKPQFKEGYTPKIYKGNDERWHVESRKSRTELEFIDWNVLQKGTILWVRETWFSTRSDNKELLEIGYTGHIKYKADNNYDPVKDCVGRSWKPSIYMPKSAARIFLKITNVRVERLNNISEYDAICEGVELLKSTNKYRDYEDCHNHFNHARISFASLWNSINTKLTWRSNPWVWVIEFERVEKPLNF